MAIAEALTGPAVIGETAGVVWKVLAAKGPLSLTKLTKECEAPKDLVLQAVGWLAREDKLVFEEGRTKTIGLKDC
ncbi:MAG: winged helix-turn-helix domain-containing protein [Planctomycetes bacterium]|nr:winged helix-turn-helix domain-containing protein [Planctomycetota bacterium]